MLRRPMTITTSAHLIITGGGGRGKRIVTLDNGVVEKYLSADRQNECQTSTAASPDLPDKSIISLVRSVYWKRSSTRSNRTTHPSTCNAPKYRPRLWRIRRIIVIPKRFNVLTLRASTSADARRGDACGEWHPRQTRKKNSAKPALFAKHQL